MNTPTLDGMTVEQLDDIIARATATKKQVEVAAAAEARDWGTFTVEFAQYRVNKLTFAVQEKAYSGWADSISFSNDMQSIKRMYTRKKYLLGALNALDPQD